jgi:hypothetical protein
VDDAVLLNASWINVPSDESPLLFYWGSEKTLMFMMMNLFATIFQSRQVIKHANVIFVVNQQSDNRSQKV